MAADLERFLRYPAVWHPKDAAEAWNLKMNFEEDGVYISGGTLLQTYWENGTAPRPTHLIDLSSIPGLEVLQIFGDTVVLGSQLKLSACRASDLLKRRFPLLVEAIRHIAAPSVRNLGTIGGNVVSGIGDSLPALLVYDTEIVWQEGLFAVTEALADFIGRLSGGSAPDGRLLTHIRLSLDSEYAEPDPAAEQTSANEKRFSAFRKVGRRQAFTPSLVTIALTGRFDRAARTFAGVRIAVGGGKTPPRRLSGVESLLNAGGPADWELLVLVYEQALREFEPAPDPFASQAYRKQTAAGLIAAELWKASAEA